MKLSDTVTMMNSSDYKERFRGEYFQLDNRIEGLSNMTEKYRKGTLEFTPKCTQKLLDAQFNAMIIYATHLKERAKIEGISLEEVVDKKDATVNNVTTNSKTEVTK
jgi:hypothetical protein